MLFKKVMGKFVNFLVDKIIFLIVVVVVIGFDVFLLIIFL